MWVCEQLLWRVCEQLTTDDLLTRRSAYSGGGVLMLGQRVPKGKEVFNDDFPRGTLCSQFAKHRWEKAIGKCITLLFVRL